MEVSRTDVERIVRILDKASTMYEQLPGHRQCNVANAFVAHQLSKKMKRKLIKNKRDEERRNR